MSLVAKLRLKYHLSEVIRKEYCTIRVVVKAKSIREKHAGGLTVALQKNVILNGPSGLHGQVCLLRFQSGKLSIHVPIHFSQHHFLNE